MCYTKYHLLDKRPPVFVQQVDRCFTCARSLFLSFGLALFLKYAEKTFLKQCFLCKVSTGHVYAEYLQKGSFLITSIL